MPLHTSVIPVTCACYPGCAAKFLPPPPEAPQAPQAADTFDVFRLCLAPKKITFLDRSVVNSSQSEQESDSFEGVCHCILPSSRLPARVTRPLPQSFCPHRGGQGGHRGLRALSTFLVWKCLQKKSLFFRKRCACASKWNQKYSVY